MKKEAQTGQENRTSQEVQEGFEAEPGMMGQDHNAMRGQGSSEQERSGVEETEQNRRV